MSQKWPESHIVFLRNHVYPRAQVLGSQSVQDVIERTEKAHKRFFEWTKNSNGRGVAPPRFKKVARYKSFTLKQACFANV